MHLFLNTAFSFIEVALFNESDLFFYEKFRDKDESLHLGNILKQNLFKGKRLDEITLNGVLISEGPGRFSSLRSGAAYAQMLTFLKKIPLYPFSSLDYLQALSSHSNLNNIKFFLQQVGLSDIFINGELKKFEHLPDGNHSYLGEVRTPEKLPEEYQEITMPDPSYEFFPTLLSQLTPQEKIDIKYGKPPNIHKK